MSEPPSIDNLISFLPRAERDVRERAATIQTASPAPERALTPWRALWSVLAVHTLELERQVVVDEAGLATIAGALDAVARHVPNEALPLPALMAEMEQRVDAILPGEFAGVSTLGLAREEWKATTVRLLWLDAVQRASMSLDLTRADLVALAEAHVMTLMPASLGGRPAQPTMLGHFLGGTISPLKSASARLDLAVSGLARSPLGAGLMSGEMIPIDRERVARKLGFTAPIANTFDATANVEDYVAVLESLTAGLAPQARLLREFAAWIRTSPNSLVLTEAWETRPEPTVPTLAISGPLMALIDRNDEAIRQAGAAVTRLRAAEYAPIGDLNQVLAQQAQTLLPEIGFLYDEIREFLGSGMMINRAYLGNRAGRGYTTAGDLAAFLMSEEQLPPAAARAIASIVAGKLSEQSLETSAVTQEMIDSAALMLIGREVKVEIEALGRYLAPRRFIERRQVTGSPAAEQLRAWLASERESLEQAGWTFRVQENLNAVAAEIAGLVPE